MTTLFGFWDGHFSLINMLHFISKINILIDNFRLLLSPSLSRKNNRNLMHKIGRNEIWKSEFDCFPDRSTTIYSLEIYLPNCTGYKFVLSLDLLDFNQMDTQHCKSLVSLILLLCYRR